MEFFVAAVLLMQLYLRNVYDHFAG